MFFPFPQPLTEGVFLGRPQRFLVDIELVDGTKKTAYCANPGSFEGCTRPGAPVLLWQSSDVSRKREYTWRAIKLGRTWIGTDTHIANHLVAQGLRQRCLPGVGPYTNFVREPRFLAECGVRLDFRADGDAGSTFIEVKSATVSQEGCAQFPDSVSPRTVEHLKKLAELSKQGHRTVLLFVIQRGDVSAMRINSRCDMKFNRAFEHAMGHGVAVVAVKHVVSRNGFGPPYVVPFEV